MLGWNPVWDFETAIDRTASWYREFYTTGSVQSTRDLDRYIADACAKEAVWTR
jgi:dTDP-D-glucose 4,6-dehydratase